MLENAKSQLFLVLLALAAGLACVLTMKIPLGPDLRGGTQLRYEVPRDVLTSMTSKEGGSIDAIMDQTIGVMQDRADPNGTIDPLITRSGDTGILMELPYFDDKLELKALEDRIANLGKLEMRIVADDLYQKHDVKISLDKEKQRLEAWLKDPANKELLAENPRNIRTFNDDIQNGPLSFGNVAWYPRLIRAVSNGASGTMVWDRPFSEMGILQKATVKAYAPEDWNSGVVPQSILAKPAEKQYLLELVAVNMNERFFTGEDLDAKSIAAGAGDNGGLAVHYAVNGARAGDYGDWSAEYINQCSAIILNGIVKSAPRFETRIPGSGRITGDFTNEEVQELIKVLRTGSLRVEPELVSRFEIGPNLGKEAIQRGVLSLAAGSIAVFLLAIWFYRLGGVIACITLLLNVFLLYAAMLFMQATITLPGLGGIVLTMGMAIDANVLIYERIREELDRGKDMLRAVRAGFERAMSAILDSNITTFLVGVVLFNVGVGPVKGFAVTLMVGIVTTVFTQFFATRLLFHVALLKNWLDGYRPRSIFTNLNADFVRHIGKCLTISSIVIVAGLAYAIFVAPREVTLGIDFTGGANLQMVVAEPTTVDVIRNRLKGDHDFDANYPNTAVNTVGSEDTQQRVTQFNVRLKLSDAERNQIEIERRADRERRQAAEKAGEAPPPDYQPPYQKMLERIFAADLVKPAASGATTVPDASGKNLQWAQIELHYAQPVALADVQAEMVKQRLSSGKVYNLDDATAPAGRNLRLEWQTQSNTRAWELFPIARLALDKVKGTNGADAPLSNPFPEAQEIQGRLVNDLRNAAIGALVLSWALIVFYLRIRFHEYKYGIGAVVALIHDVLVTFGVVVFVNHMGWVHVEISMSLIACFLTIIGYSVNDTIIIYDRIRECVHDNARDGTNEPFPSLINKAINQTMSRTVLTTGLTMLVVIAQFFVNWGSESDLESFAFGMLVGMVTGTYSSIYIAAPLLIWLHKDEPTKPGVVVTAAANKQPQV